MGARILRRRKEKRLTQEALANRLGVSNQAVSKWEGDVCCPDLQLLPLLADTLKLSLDELFGLESNEKPIQKAEADSQSLPVAAELPWEDDDAIHAVLFQGHRLLQPKQGSLFRHDKYDEIRKTVELHFSGTAQDIYSDFSVVCTDSTISGSVRAGDGVTCTDVGGDVTAGDSVRCGDVKGNVRPGDSVTCGDVSGSVSAERVRCTKAVGEEQEGFTFTKKGKSFSFFLPIKSTKARCPETSRFFPCHRGGFVLP